MNTTATLVKNIIKARKSIFPAEYTGEPIPQEVIDDILDIATYAPNHKKTKPWRLKAFRGAEKTALGAELQRLYKERISFLKIPTTLLPKRSPRPIPSSLSQ